MTDHTETIPRKTALWMGLSGIAGSLVLFTGDMLFYYDGAGTDLLVTMAGVSRQRIVLSAVCALIAAWLYTAASGQIFFAFQPARTWCRRGAFLSFAAIMIAYGVVHGAFVAIAVSAGNAATAGLPPDALIGTAAAVDGALRSVAYAPFIVFTLLFLYCVPTGRTRYPRWFVLFCPVIPFLLGDFVTGSLEGRWRTIVAGGYLNLILLVFFTASTLTLLVTTGHTNASERLPVEDR